MIHDFFTVSINTRKIKKVLFILKANLLIISIFSLLSAIDIYWLVSKSNLIQNKATSFFFNFRLWPVISVIVLSLDIVGYFMVIKFSSLILTSIEDTNPEAFNKGYDYFYKATLIAFVSYLITLLSLSTRLFLYAS